MTTTEAGLTQSMQAKLDLWRVEQEATEVEEFGEVAAA